MDSDEDNQEQPYQIDGEFIEAVASNDLEKFKGLLESKMNMIPEPPLKERNAILSLSLILAAEKGYADIVEFLLKQEGIEVNEKNAKGFTALDLASENGFLKIVELLLECENIRVWNPNQITPNPLHLAAENGHLSVVDVLVRKRGISQMKIFHKNVSYSDCDSDSDPDNEERTAYFTDSEVQYGRTPLHLAAENGHTAIVDLLLRMGAKIFRDESRFTPLHSAADGGHAEVVKLLLYSICDTSRYDYSPDDYDDYEDYSLRHTTLCVKLKCDSKMTPLHLAAKGGHDEVVRILLTNVNTIVNATNSRGSSALHFATKGGHLESIKHLLKHPGIQNLKDNSGKTALEIAQEKGYSLCAETLAKHFK